MESSEMENRLKGAYNEMICVDDDSSDRHPICLDQDRQQVSMFTVRDGPGPQHYRVAAVCLGLLSALLLAVDIALGVQYNKIRGGHLPLYLVSSELMQLRANFSIVTQAHVKSQAHLESETYQMHQTSQRLGGYRRTNDGLLLGLKTLQEERTTLLSRITQLEESCARCMPRWELLNSMCYYFPSDTAKQVSWQDGRSNCLKQGADLVVIDSGEKQRVLGETINYRSRHKSTPKHMSGYWMGLHDMVKEGTWKWLNGEELTQGYWADGEPNDHYGYEDCAAIYPGRDQRKSWNDAPCGHPLKWICEMKPKN